MNLPGRLLAALAVFTTADHPELASGFSQLGLAYGGLEDHKRALGYHEKALAMRERIHGGDHGSVAQALTTLANAHRAAGNAAEAVDYSKRATAMRARLKQK
jgi:preprotein translocase subunit SecA/nephrocystin-3